MKTHTFLLSCLITACGASGGFTDVEGEIITSQKGGIMRLYTTESSEDCLLLRRNAAPLGRAELASDEYRLLKQGMLSTVRDTTNAGVGIAAPQVGISRRLIAVQRFDKPGEPFEFYVNPEIVSYSEEKAEGQEGCLSIPDVSGMVSRSETIVLNYTDEESMCRMSDTISGFTAVIFQHEIDHLNGILFTDRLSGQAAE
ncbi:peptide deformylase [uncultured Alistipes sp.]|jgi:peptide deformylase|uniref:peptide deformylase n=1 Tax=uncultured Alistipes sp. TaxID=538949 RepID=UPI0025DA167C|nr:peptide deformylase [uncultured Alistipes sp.]